MAFVTRKIFRNSFNLLTQPYLEEDNHSTNSRVEIEHRPSVAETGQILEDPENEVQVSIPARIKSLTGELKKPFKEIGYEKSSELLKELQNLRGSDDLDILLKLAECHLHLMSDKKDSSIQDIANFISTSESLSAMDIANAGLGLQLQGYYVRAMILYQISHHLHNTEEKLSPDDELKWVSSRVADIQRAIKPLTEDSTSRNIALNYGLKYMNDMLIELRSVENGSPDVRALSESSCLANITAINIRVGENEKVIELCEAGNAMMENQFGENVSNFKLYGQLLSNLGNAYHNSRQYSKAESCYVTAIEVSEDALDFENERQRQHIIRNIQRNLTSTRKYLPKH